MTSSGQGGTSFENVSVASPNDDTSFGRASSYASLAWGRWFAGTSLGMRRGSVPFCHGGITMDSGDELKLLFNTFELPFCSFRVM